MISERLRIRAEVKGAADIAAGRKKPEYGKESEIEWEAADLIDALVAALERAANEGQKGQLSLHALMACGDALAMARKP
jgi:hypothetical protein